MAEQKRETHQGKERKSEMKPLEDPPDEEVSETGDDPYPIPGDEGDGGDGGN